MAMLKLLFIIQVVILVSLCTARSLNFCGDWTEYRDIKCVKVIDDSVAQDVAIASCKNYSASLVTIHSQDEQDFLNNLLNDYKNTSMGAWIGMKNTGSSYEWMDGTTINYTNWDKDPIKDGNENCAESSLMTEFMGKWTDVSCTKALLIVCEKKQYLSFVDLRSTLDQIESSFDKIIQNQNTKIEELEQKLNNTPVGQHFPKGFLYTQFPNQSDPIQLWPDLKWTEVTGQYSGLFFRAEGNGAESFGQIQQANQSYISDINVQSASYNGWGTGYYRYNLSASIMKDGGSWTHLNPNYLFDEMWIYTTSGEVRPRNTAIKIWKRV